MFRLFTFGVFTALSLACPLVTAQSVDQQRFGFPHTELSFVDELSGNVIISCLSQIDANRVVAHYDISLRVATDSFPIRFELESAESVESVNECGATTNLSGSTVTGLVEVADELNPGQNALFHYVLSYLGQNENGVEELVLEESAIFQVVEGATIIQPTGQALVTLTPESFNQNNSYEIHDAISGRLLNDEWQLQVTTNELQFTPIGQVYCDITVTDLSSGLIDFITVDTGSGASDSSHPSLRSCDLNEVYDRYSFGLFDLPADEQSLDFLAELDAGWVRAQFRLGEANPATLSAITEQLFASSNKLWLTLHYRNPANIADQAGLEASQRGSYPPTDAEMYQQEVTEFIGIFVDQLQAEGLDPQDYLIVQFSNEVLPNDIAPDQPQRYFHGSSDEYLEMLALTNAAVKNSGFEIPVAPGGFASSTMELLLDYDNDPAAFTDLQPVYDWNVRMLREGNYEWVDIHMRNEIESIANKVNWVRKFWLGPISATEVGGFCDITCTDEEVDAYTPDVQAADLPIRIQTILEAGIETAFWASLVESPDQEPQYEREGLLTADFVEKPAFDAYKSLIQELTSD
ncbi:MAG: hypothetical protein MI746_01040 [Pseudomonadales bacterium]|nr:hypothetical protein [Pseudomonadales bacterium]